MPHPSRYDESCILSKFYIKPQLSMLTTWQLTVVSYRNSTSNHNLWLSILCLCVLYLIEILHQTTTLALAISLVICCILSKFYIKPQLRQGTFSAYKVVSYRNSTSNHNFVATVPAMAMLYLIEILHQTTTAPLMSFPVVRLYLIEILHQTTTSGPQN